MSAPFGAVVRHGERFGTLVRGPRRASRGMAWVVWEGSDKAVQMHRWTLAYVAKQGPVERVKAVLAAMLAAGAVLLAVLTGTAAAQPPGAGAFTCPNGPGHYAQRLNGDLLIVCPGPPMTPEQARQQREQAVRIFNDEQERTRRLNMEFGACGPDVPRFRRPPSCP